MKELYNAIVGRLHERLACEIFHIDLWNHNVEFAELEEPWPTPALFVEFQPVQWGTLVKESPRRLTANARVNLRLVTRANGSTSGSTLEENRNFLPFDLSLAVAQALDGLSGQTFRNFRLDVSNVNHNHEELIETIDEYSVTFIRNLNPQP